MEILYRLQCDSPQAAASCTCVLTLPSGRTEFVRNLNSRSVRFEIRRFFPDAVEFLLNCEFF
jgi:hypothetical protein